MLADHREVIARLYEPGAANAQHGRQRQPVGGCVPTHATVGAEAEIPERSDIALSAGSGKSNTAKFRDCQSATNEIGEEWG
jgi:hypothetical protein